MTRKQAAQAASAHTKGRMNSATVKERCLLRCGVLLPLGSSSSFCFSSARQLRWPVTTSQSIVFSNLRGHSRIVEQSEA